MEAAKEKILNISASAKAGMDKTMAVAEEKAEKVKTNDPLQKKRAEDRKQEKIHQAELEKQQAYQQQAYQQNAIRKGEAQHAEAGHQTGLGGHHTGVEQQAGLNEPTGGLTGLHRTDPPTIGTKANPTGHETSAL